MDDHQYFDRFYTDFVKAISPLTTTKRVCEIALERVKELKPTEIENSLMKAQRARVHNKEFTLQIWIMQLKLRKLTL